MAKNKLVSLRTLKKHIGSARKKGKTIVFTNGCFDIIHAGHVRYLNKSKSLGDILIAGLNSDISVKKIKGEKRPIVPQKERAEVLSGLEAVDYVVIFNEPTPIRLIKATLPDVLVKG
ncbi:MAG: adenylyltransferase/cytidyltransferase family protein, partial [Deltaproteobacteria bacterium]